MTNHTIHNTKTSILIISKGGSLSECVVEPSAKTTLEELTVLLSKKCGNRNHDGFSCYHTYKYKNKRGVSFPLSDVDVVVPPYIYVDVWGKTDGRAGYENKYEMPPPIDDLMFYGNIALVARSDGENAIDMTTELWDIIYEKLFGGFEDLAASAIDDENESDELDSIPLHKKTRGGYLKDGFVVDDDDATPRCRVKGRGGKKNKSESTESEFITETDTTSSDPEADADTTSTEADADVPLVECISSKKAITKPKRIVNTKPTSVVKSKRAAAAAAAASAAEEQSARAQESESELSEEDYV
jgi:hypothetical protein